MLILMTQGASREQIDQVCRRIREAGLTPHEIPGSIRTAIGITGNRGPISAELFTKLPGVSECMPVSKPYKLVSREVKPESTIIDVRGAKVGGDSPVLMAGPCSVETRDQTLKTAEAVVAGGAKFFRGGAFKPRTSPYAFRGLKQEGLKILEEVKRTFDLRIVTEVMDIETMDAVAEVADVLQIGARNMQNFSLLEAAGRQRKPVLLKRGMSATIQELFMAAEYLLSLDNYAVMLCERGIRTFETMTRNTFDLSAVVMMKHYSHLPVIADPSHGVGIDWAVPPLAKAALVAGADGVIIEVHPDPDRALSDGQQSLNFEEFAALAADLKDLADWRASRAK
ncbi:MAG TPA: 3-deoxy-7-phosphoheptulonate synthase [Phycisphaerae bacterium]|jgi:3-deoxy-7-phosphoheptulonate synthase|nr:3-deoxy-7-phosphoheptulonate synthase [Phycisphaerae bacterium]HOB73090.1 3-deoxy-7-phosphoheptulonate synthase [Phycisphaerae bacterium]HOJ54029.1 3-deoxy-7-phosphoheptulonate synthase [Phycisphaerae bacterium]HOL26440.1 3-deoxy-7-phosphoheptulonate synthase [Phycisphaerae bacterium]HPP20419.1 3-deoxy-7-phosphoheptulonate synthase [Phycisphaerae bacterium]